MKQSNRYFCGIDFGGTAAKIGIVDEKGILTATERVEISAGDGYDDIFGRVAKQIRSRCAKLGVYLAGIGIGSPGFIDRSEGRVLQGSENLPAFKNRSLIKYLSDDFALPVFADNDANCAAAGELKFGIGAGYDSFVMITLGAGVGGALVLEGKILRGTRGLAGEIGHICLDEQGPFCTCGSRGCFEQYASASAIERSYLEKCGKRAKGPDGQTGAESVTAEMVFQRAGEEDYCAIGMLPVYLGIWSMYSTRRPALSVGVFRQPGRNCWSL
jgi:glucokinase